jgi:hypothetical protein
MINSICDHSTKITASLNGRVIDVTIESSCGKIMEYALLIKKLTIKEIARDIINNPIYIKASESRSAHGPRQGWSPRISFQGCQHSALYSRKSDVSPHRTGLHAD